MGGPKAYGQILLSFYLLFVFPAIPLISISLYKTRISLSVVRTNGCKIIGFLMASESHTFNGLCYPFRTNWSVAYLIVLFM